MNHKIYRVTSFEIVGPDTLRVSFDDETDQIVCIVITRHFASSYLFDVGA